MADDNLDEQPENWSQVGEQFIAGVARHITVDTVMESLVGALVKLVPAIVKLLDVIAVPVAAAGGKILVDLEEPVLPILAAFVAPIVSNLFGTEADAELFASRNNREGRADAARQIVEAFTAALVGDSTGEAEPSQDGAQRIASAAVHAALEGWFNELIPELLGDMIPVDWMHFPAFTGLSEEIIRTLGVGRLVRRAFSPLVDATAATPMKWATNKTYRPNLLSEGDIVKAFLRGDYTADDAAEELARLGYSDRRQAQLVKNSQKRLSLDDILTLARHGGLDRDYALQNLRDEGYDAETAELSITAAETKRLDSRIDDSISTIVRAYVNRDIDDGQFGTLLPAVVLSDDERDALAIAARTQRDLNVKHLTKAEVIECITAEVLPFAFYRDWLAREGYPPDEAAALEVLLRTQIDASVKAADARAAIAAEKAKAANDKQAANDKHLADLEAQRALQRRGSIADLRRAVARGLIPLDRLGEVLRAQYDDDTVQIILQLAEQDRVDYVAQQQAAADAKKRAAARNIDLGSLEQGVLRHIITVDAYRAAVADRGFTPADVSILTATLAAKLKDQDDAAAKRAAADQAAKVKHIDLGRLERLVRRGIRTMADYTALLQQLGYDDGSIAAMVALLNSDIADDTAARALRDAAKRKAAGPELTLEQFRRAVILGIRSDADFQAFLVRQGYTADNQAVLVAELRRDVADAETARHQRQTDDGAAGGVDLPLSRITAAARLGIITPDAYAERLRAIGYSDDDVAIEMELLVTEIANVQAARTEATAADTANAGRGLSLADLARAVKAGTASTADYRARALALGFSADDADTLAATLDAELSTYASARTRRTVIVQELTARGIDLAALEATVGAGALTIDAYRAQLQAFGYGAADAQLLGALLTFTLAGGAA